MSSQDNPHNIVVCCDGTWCGAETGTRGNIQIIADGFASQGQPSYVQTFDGKPVYNSYTNTDICYFNGAGLDGLEDLAKKGKHLGLLGGFGDTLLYIANGVIANDLPERCKEAYGFIMDSYKGPGESRVWLFGLSRGAYTVRAVAGMINNCGILNPAAAAGATRSAALQQVWQMYRSDNPDDKPGGTNARAFRAGRSWPRGEQPPVIFMGLLDTVGAEGVPRIKPQGDPASAFTYKYSFRDLVVSSEVQHVFQAASTHDRLAPFEPCPVRRSDKLAAGAAGETSSSSSTGHYPGVKYSMQEVWFPGAHYDVGRQDFVFSNQPITNTLFRVLNPLRTNVACTPELADYPLLGRALPAHGGPSPPPRLIGVPSTAVNNVALQAAATASAAGDSADTGSAAASSSSAGVLVGINGVAASGLCLVAQVNRVQPGMLPPAADSAWEDLVKGDFADLTCRSRGHRPLGLTSTHDLGLLRPLCGSHSLLFALLQAGTRVMLPAVWLVQKLTARLPLPLFQPAYTIDAESKILGPLVSVVAYLLDTTPGLVLKDRIIPLPTPTGRHGLAVPAAVFFPVPRDEGSFASYKPGGRPGEWFMSDTYLAYQQGLLVAASVAGTITDGAAAAEATAADAEEGLGAMEAVAELEPALGTDAKERLMAASSAGDAQPIKDQ